MAGSLAWDIGTAVNFEYDEDGFPTVQIDALGEEKSGVAPYDLHSPHGFLSVPVDPDVDDNGTPTLGCTTLFAMEGGRGHAWLCADPRVIVKLPTLQKGEALFYNSLGQFIRMDNKGAISLFTTDDGTTDGKSVYLRIAKDSLQFVAPWGVLIFDAAGFRIRHASGARMALGGIGGIPLGLGSYFKAEAAMVDISGQAVAAGPKGAADPLTKSTPLIAFLTQLIEMLATTPAVSPGSPLLPAASTLTSQLDAIVAQMSSP